MFLNIFHIVLSIITCFYWLILGFTTYPDSSNGPILLLSALTAWVTAFFSWKNIQDVQKTTQIFYTVMLSVASPVVMFVATNIFLELNMQYQTRKYTAENDTEQKNEQGFLRIKKFAANQYGIPLRLGGYEESWALTTLRIPQASVASLRTETGYCTINLSDPNMYNMYVNTKYSGPYKDWKLLILAHEFAHCVDRTSDLSPTMGSNVISLNSIAPAARTDVKDVYTFIDAEDKEPTQLWREAFADLFAVGYMYVEDPQIGHKLEDSLINYRKNRNDVIHSTSCWLDYARDKSKPKASEGILLWANDIRTKAPCPVGK